MSALAPGAQHLLPMVIVTVACCYSRQREVGRLTTHTGGPQLCFKILATRKRQKDSALIQWGPLHQKVKTAHLPVSVTDPGAKSRKHFLPEDLMGQTVGRWCAAFSTIPSPWTRLRVSRGSLIIESRSCVFQLLRINPYNGGSKRDALLLSQNSWGKHVLMKCYSSLHKLPISKSCANVILLARQ